MTAYKTIKVEKALNLDDLKKKPTPRGRRPNPRDEELTRLVTEVAAGAKSQVIPWRPDGKLPTARLAANKAIKAAGLEGSVYASTRPDLPGLILFSRVPLTRRQGQERAG
jgi:hypothetical protein